MSQAETSHTPEPWHFSSADNSNVAQCLMGDNVASDATAKANARRIVACVNACAGLSTKALEKYPGMFLRIVETAEQRDELAEALRVVVALEIEPGAITTGRALAEAIAVARAALAKVSA